MLEVLLLDVDGTLLDFSMCARQAMEESFFEKGLEFREEYFCVFNEINDDLWRQVEKNIITVPTLWNTRWDLIFRRLGLRCDGVSFEKSFHSKLERSHVPFEGARDTVKALSEKYRLFVASNAPAGQQEFRLQQEGMLEYFEGLFVSGELGTVKPSREFFDICLERACVLPQEAMMIGDSVSADIEGALNAGIAACWYNPHKKQAPDRVKPTHTVCSYEELKKLLL